MTKHAEPAIPLFGDAYLADTRHLSLEEHGAYLQLLMIAWRIEGCRLPDDDTRLSRMLGITAARWRKLKPTVMGFWQLMDGHWSQARLSKERTFVDEKRAKNKSSAETRWESQEPENKQGDGCERIAKRNSERNAPPPPPPKKGSVADATGDKSPIPPSAIDLKAAVFSVGPSLLLRLGAKSDRDARSMLGRWRKDFGDGAVLDALTAAEAVSPSDGIPFIQRTLERRNGRIRGVGSDPLVAAYRSALEEERAERDAQTNDLGAWPALPPGQCGSA